MDKELSCILDEIENRLVFFMDNKDHIIDRKDMLIFFRTIWWILNRIRKYDRKEKIISEQESFGTWIPISEESECYECSNCGLIRKKLAKYCPECGKKMYLGGKELYYVDQEGSN